MSQFVKQIVVQNGIITQATAAQVDSASIQPGGILSGNIGSGQVGWPQLAPTGVTSGAHGSGTLIPIYTTNLAGQVTAFSTTPMVVQDKGGQAYNVVTYGAVGNGTTDDATAFQNCINDAISAGGKTVYIPPPPGGVSYKIGSTITIQPASNGNNTVNIEAVGSFAPINYTGANGTACFIIQGMRWSSSFDGLSVNLSGTGQIAFDFRFSATLSSMPSLFFHRCNVQFSGGGCHRGYRVGQDLTSGANDFNNCVWLQCTCSNNQGTGSIGWQLCGQNCLSNRMISCGGEGLSCMVQCGSVSTVLSGNITNVQTTIPLFDASLFSSIGGTGQISSGAGAEQFTYTGKSGNTLTGVTRGTGGTTAQAWGGGVTVTEYIAGEGSLPGAGDWQWMSGTASGNSIDFNIGGADQVLVSNSRFENGFQFFNGGVRGAANGGAPQNLIIEHVKLAGYTEPSDGWGIIFLTNNSQTTLNCVFISPPSGVLGSTVITNKGTTQSQGSITLTGCTLVASQPFYTLINGWRLNLVGTNIVNADNSANKIIDLNQTYNIAVYGADPTGSIDSSAAILACYNAIPSSGGIMEIPAGQYKLNGGTLNNLGTKPVLIRGAGWYTEVAAAFGNAQWTAANAVTGSVLLIQGASDGLSLGTPTAGTNNGLVIQDIALIGPGTGTSTGINCSTGGGGLLRSRFDNVFVANFSTGINLGISEDLCLVQLSLYGNQTGLSCPYNVSAGTGITDVQIYRIACQTNTTGINVAAAANLKIYGGVIQSNTKGIVLQPTTSLEGIHLDDLWFESNSTSNIVMDTTSGGISTPSITCCRFSSDGSSGFSIDFTGANAVNFLTMKANKSGTFSIPTTCWNAHIAGNGFSGLSLASALSAYINITISDSHFPGIVINSTNIVIDTNGTTTAPIQDKGGQVFNVKAYGAKGDGVADDTSAIQSAINAAVLAGSGNGGGYVLFPPPVNYYNVQSQLLIQPGGSTVGASTSGYCRIHMAGFHASDGFSTGIVWNGPSNTSMFVLHGVTESTFEDISVAIPPNAGIGNVVVWDLQPTADCGNFVNNNWSKCTVLFPGSGGNNIAWRTGRSSLSGAATDNISNTHWFMCRVEDAGTQYGSIGWQIGSQNNEPTQFDACITNQLAVQVITGALPTQVPPATTVASGDTTIPANSTTLFPSSGYFKVDSEVVGYGGKTGSGFTSCLRGQLGTSIASHGAGAGINQYLTSPNMGVLPGADILTWNGGVGTNNATDFWFLQGGRYSINNFHGENGKRFLQTGEGFSNIPFVVSVDGCDLGGYSLPSDGAGIVWLAGAPNLHFNNTSWFNNAVAFNQNFITATNLASGTNGAQSGGVITFDNTMVYGTLPLWSSLPASWIVNARGLFLTNAAGDVTNTVVRENRPLISLTDSGTVNLDLSYGNVFSLPMSAAVGSGRTLTLSNASVWQNFNLYLQQPTSSGPCGVTWFNGIRWQSGVTPTLTSGKIDKFSFDVIQSGVYLGTPYLGY